MYGVSSGRTTQLSATALTLIIRSPAPVANHLFPGSTVNALTQPKCPEMTRMSFHCGWYCGFSILAAASFFLISAVEREVPPPFADANPSAPQCYHAIRGPRLAGRSASAREFLYELPFR
jgi:hypothetical protein